MAAIVPDDPYQCLMRKIGYSVGLEDLLKRVRDLTDLYVAQRELNYALFRDLVTIKFQRNNERSIKEFANVYGSLNLLKLYGKKLHVLPNLDTLSILRQYFADDQKSFTSAAKVVLMESVLEADGEIFINMRKVVRDARRDGSSTKKMLGFLFIHGLLHLEGMPHGSKMEAKERAFQKKFSI